MAAACALARVAIVSGWWWIARGNETGLPTGTPKQITSLQEWEAEPALSPDGTLIAYSSETSGNSDIWLTDVQGGSALQLTNDPASDHNPTWFPNGSHVAFVSARQGRRAIWSVPTFGGLPVWSSTTPKIRRSLLTAGASPLSGGNRPVTSACRSRLCTRPRTQPH